MLRSPELDHLRFHGGSATGDDQAREEVEEGGDVFNPTLSQATVGDRGNRRVTRSLSDPGHAVETDNSETDGVTWNETPVSMDSDGLEHELASTDDDAIRTESISTQEWPWRSTAAGSLATVIGNVIRTGLEKGRLDFDTWCIDMCQEMETVPLALEDLISVLKSILQDDSPVAIRQACISLKVELLEILEEVDFRLLMFLKIKCEQIQESGRLFKTSLQEDLINNVVLHLLEDDDSRVRQAAAKCLASMVPQLFYSLNNDKQALVISAAQSQISSLYIHESQCKAYTQSVIDANLSRVVSVITAKLNHSTSRTCMLGCIHVLSLLTEAFPVASYPGAWGCSVSLSCRSPLPTHAIGPFSTPPRPSSPSAACTGGGGPLSVAVGSMISSWLAYDLFAHRQLLQIAGNILFGAGCSGVHVSLKLHSERGPSDEPISSAEHWSVFTDSALAPQAEKLVFHLARVLNIFSHVVDNTIPGAHSFKISFPGQNKDKQQSAAIPGVATPQTPPPTSLGSSPATALPKRLLTKSKRALSEADLHQVTSERPVSPSKTQGGGGQPTESEQNTQGPPPKSSIGMFHHLPHYMKLYEIIKGAYSNNQVTLIGSGQDKFCQFLAATLDALSVLLEVTAFADIGKHVEEIIGYLQVCVKLEATKTFLCVQQLLRAMFGVNALSQPELIQTPLVPPCLAYSHVTLPAHTDQLQALDESLYHSCFVHPLALITQTLEKLKLRDEVKEKGKEEALGGIGVFIKKLTKKAATSVRPAVKVDKQSPIHSFIRWFEPLVIRALKEYTMSSNVILQQQVLSLLAQLIKLRVNYSLLDADQVFISYVQKQFEYIDAGQIKSCNTFLPHIFQFLVLLSYECFQPKFNQAKAIVGMPRIIQLCDGIMAGGQPAQTHGIPALQPIVHDLFVLRAAGKSDTGEDLETQREVVVSMLLRLVHFPEVLEMLVTVLNCYQRDEVKWKNLSGQVIGLLLPPLANQKVQVQSEYGIEMLQAVFTAVAPGSLWPVDVLLRVLFSSVDQTQSDAFSRWLATVLVVLQTLMAQVTEDILLSRIDQSGFRPKCVSMIDKPLLPIEVLVKFLFHVVEMAASRVNMITRSSFVNLGSPSEEVFLLKLFGCILTCLTHLLKSANFKKVSQVASSSPIIQPSVDVINESVCHLVDTHPVLVLQWCQVLRQLKYMNVHFWCGFLDTGSRLSTASGGDIELEGPTMNKDVTRVGVLLIYCDLLITQHMEQGALDLSQAGTLLRMSLEDLVQMKEEPPVQGFLSILYSTQEGSKLLLDSFSSSRSLCETTKQPSLMKNLLSFTRMAERLICKKLEMCTAGQIGESSQDFIEDELRSVCQLIASKKAVKRNPTLLLLLNKILPCRPPVEREMPCSEDLASSMNNYTIDREWFYRLAQQCCFAGQPKDQKMKANIPHEAIQMLSVLSVKEVSEIVNHEDFDFSLLEECILRGIERTLMLTARRQNTEEGTSDLYNNTEQSENNDIDHLLLVSKLTLFSQVKRVTKDVIRTRTFRDSENSSKIQCFHLASDRLTSLCNDADWCKKVTCLAKALVALSSAIPSLPKHCKIPESGQEAVFHFVFVPLAMVHCNFMNGKRPCSSELKSHLECLAKFLNLDCSRSIGDLEFFPLVCSAISHVRVLLNAVDGGADTNTENSFTDETEIDVTDDGIQIARKACGEISLLIHRLLTIVKPGSGRKTSLPQFLIGPFHDVIVGLARQPLVNSYARTLPLVWKMGWAPVPEGPLKTELPPLPIEILKEKDVLDEFVRRVNLIGWTSRQQFEETWAALLGVISSPPLPDTVSTEEDMESTHSCCLGSPLYLRTAASDNLVPSPRQPNHECLSSQTETQGPAFPWKQERNLLLSEAWLEEEFVAMCCTGTGRAFISDEELRPERSASIHRSNSFLCLNSSSSMWITNRMLFDHPLYGLNIDRVLGFHDYTLGQISVGALHTQAQNELQERYDSEDDTAVVVSLPRMPQPEKLDIKSCEQFLLELFEQWMSPYIHPRTPLALLSEATKAVSLGVVTSIQ
ncbi:hypothetical protein OS493_011839 [Desmophyllum pertusum]|uniref:Huntingtin n=1 Tax=Desmophyllum pertusum TaxID=174260 RepID=A0A9X0CFU9_9CNID|nr:hypothetical protein OS493_011839 [Desmophyllum pertusum]